jgi:hypothetical protein
VWQSRKKSIFIDSAYAFQLNYSKIKRALKIDLPRESDQLWCNLKKGGKNGQEIPEKSVNRA